MEQDQEALKKEAIEKKKANQSRIAVVKLKKSKLCEKEIAKLEGQLMMLEQQKMLIESADWDQKVFEDMKLGVDTLAAIQGDMNVEEVENIQDSILEQQADADEVAGVFIRMGEEGAEGLEDELDDLLKADAKLLTDSIPKPNTEKVVVQPSINEDVPAQQADANADEEAELMAML